MTTHQDTAVSIAEAVSRFHKDQQGVAPASVQAWLVSDAVLVRCEGVFTPTEQSLCETTDGRKIVQSARRELRALTRRQIEAEVARAIGVDVLRSYCDLDVRYGEQVEVYILARSL
ncbi:MAG TPA: DUF2294 domain-containing protein [Fimbriimonas sp.]